MGKTPPSDRDGRPGTDSDGVTPEAGTGEGAPRPVTPAERAQQRLTESERMLDFFRKRRQKVHVPFTAAIREDYLDALELLFEYQAAADWVGVNPRTVRDHREADKDFAAECEIARERYRNRISAEVHRRGAVGWDRPVYQGGKLVGWTHEASDRMLEMDAKRHIPEYRDHVDIAHSGDVGITTGVLVIPSMTAPGVTPPRVQPAGAPEPDRDPLDEANGGGQ